MDVLNFVTTADSPFFRQQVAVLSRQGTSCTNVSVPGRHEAGENGADRTVLDYVRFYPRALKRSLDDHDLVHANSGLTGPAAIAQPNRPLVLSLWGTELTNKYAPVSTAAGRLSDAVIVMSPEMARLYGRDCWIVPHGVDMDRFAPADTERARVKLDWDHEASHVLFPYSPERRIKNYPRARRVVDAVDERMDDSVHLQTIGDVPHDRMPTYMNAADALILPSEFEGSPNVVKEALACNLPVVSTPVGDVRERVEAAAASTVAETDEALADGLVAALRRDVTPSGRDAITEVSLSRMGDRLRAIYGRTLAAEGEAVPAATDTVSVPRYESGADAVRERALPVPKQES